MKSKKDKLKKLLTSGYFYSINQLSSDCGLTKQRVREYISRLKNAKITTPPMSLVQIQDEEGEKRWGVLEEKVKIG